jgi:hypothetical protein
MFLTPNESVDDLSRDSYLACGVIIQFPVAQAAVPNGVFSEITARLRLPVSRECRAGSRFAFRGRDGLAEGTLCGFDASLFVQFLPPPRKIALAHALVLSALLDVST